MPHIHTEPGQHDMTTSAYIIRVDETEPKLLVHMHKKFGKLMQVGGHIELDETPWRALEHEVLEESGYTLDELKLLQPQKELITLDHAVIHPVPLLMNTHSVSQTHYHSDLVYGFVTDKLPSQAPADGESSDLRWLTNDELQAEVANGAALEDVAHIFAAITKDFLPLYYRVDANTFSLDEPLGGLL